MGSGSKYETLFDSTKNKTFLKIKNIDVTDSGNYTLLAVRDRIEKFIYSLNVTGRLQV